MTDNNRAEALAAVSYCLKMIRNDRIPKEDNAIWSSGSSQQPRITEDILETIQEALSPPPDNAEAVRVLYAALQDIEKEFERLKVAVMNRGDMSLIQKTRDALYLDGVLAVVTSRTIPAISHPAVVAAMKNTTGEMK